MAYTTADPKDIDFMYQMPEQMMLQAVQTSDANIDKISDQNDALGQYVNSIKALPGDQDDLKTAANSYRSQIGNITSAIQKDPANYRRLSPQLRTISRTLQSDPVLAGVQSRYNQVSEWQKNNDKLVQEGKIDPILYQNYKNNVLNQQLESSKYNPQTKTFGNLNLSNISASVDWNKKSEEWMKGAVPVTTGGTDNKVIRNSEGEMLVTTDNGRIYMSPQRVKQIWEDNKNNDAQAQNSIQQYNQFLPKLNPTNDPNHSYNPSLFNVGYGDNMASNALNATLNKYSQDDRTSKSKTEVNPLYKFNTERNDEVADNLIKRKNTLDDNAEKLRQHVATLYGSYIAGKTSSNPDDKTAANSAFNEAKALGIDLGQYDKTIQASNQNGNQPIIQTTNTVTPTDAVKTTSTGTLNPTPSQPEVKQNQSGSVVVNNYNGEKKLTSSLVFGKIHSTQDMIDQLSKDRDNIPHDDAHKNEIGSYNEQIRNAKDALDNYSTIFNQSKNDITSKLIKEKGYTEEEINAARTPSTLGKINNELAPLINEYNNSQNNTTTPNINLLNQIKQLQDTKSHIENIRDNYNDEQAKWFDKNSTNTSHSVDYIGINSDEGKSLISTIKANPNQVSIIDPSTGNDLSKTTFGGYKNATTFKEAYIPDHTYSMNENNPKSLINYIKEKGKDLSDVLDIQGVSSPVPGMGVTVTTKIKDVPGLDPNKTYMLKVPSSIATSFASGYTPKNEQETTIKTNIINREKSNFISNASDMVKNGGEDLPKVLTIQNPIAGKDGSIGNITLKITPKKVGNETRMFVEGSSDGGKTFVKPRSFPESFNSIQEIANAIYK